MEFKVMMNEGKARRGVMKTRAGVIKTPAFIPVATAGTVKALRGKELEEMGVQGVLGNTYHLYLRPGVEVVEKMGGLHGFMNWQRPIITDSGGFQIFSLNNVLCKVYDDKVVFKSHVDDSLHEFTAEKSMEIQRKLGGEIIFSFDECIPFEASYEVARKSVERTHKWSERCLEVWDGKQALFGIVQGGRFKELREESARFNARQEFSGLGMGSIFGEPKKESLKLVEETVKWLPEERPRHLLGVGAVEDIFNYTELGFDSFDCVLPTRLGRAGYVFSKREGLGKRFRYRILQERFRLDRKGLEEGCGCYVCRHYSRGYIRHLFKAEELLAYSLVSYHNLWFFMRLMEEIRKGIEEGRFKELKKGWLKKGF